MTADAQSLFQRIQRLNDRAAQHRCDTHITASPSGSRKAARVLHSILAVGSDRLDIQTLKMVGKRVQFDDETRDD